MNFTPYLLTPPLCVSHTSSLLAPKGHPIIRTTTPFPTVLPPHHIPFSAILQTTPWTPASRLPLDPHNPDVVPMEIDSIRRGPLAAQEKDRRRNERLCLYCGQPDHFVTSCPNKPLPKLAPPSFNLHHIVVPAPNSIFPFFTCPPPPHFWPSL